MKLKGIDLNLGPREFKILSIIYENHNLLTAHELMNILKPNWHGMELGPVNTVLLTFTNIGFLQRIKQNNNEYVYSLTAKGVDALEKFRVSSFDLQIIKFEDYMKVNRTSERERYLLATTRYQAVLEYNGVHYTYVKNPNIISAFVDLRASGILYNEKQLMSFKGTYYCSDGKIFDINKNEFFIANMYDIDNTAYGRATSELRIVNKRIADIINLFDIDTMIMYEKKLNIIGRHIKNNNANNMYYVEEIHPNGSLMTDALLQIVNNKLKIKRYQSRITVEETIELTNEQMKIVNNVIFYRKELGAFINNHVNDILKDIDNRYFSTTHQNKTYSTLSDFSALIHSASNVVFFALFYTSELMYILMTNTYSQSSIYKTEVFLYYWRKFRNTIDPKSIRISKKILKDLEQYDIRINNTLI